MPKIRRLRVPLRSSLPEPQKVEQLVNVPMPHTITLADGRDDCAIRWRHMWGRTGGVYWWMVGTNRSRRDRPEGPRAVCKYWAGDSWSAHLWSLSDKFQQSFQFTIENTPQSPFIDRVLPQRRLRTVQPVQRLGDSTAQFLEWCSRPAQRLVPIVQTVQRSSCLLAQRLVRQWIHVLRRYLGVFGRISHIFLRESGIQILRSTSCSQLAAWRSMHSRCSSFTVFTERNGIISTSPLCLAVILSSQFFARVQFLGAPDDQEFSVVEGSGVAGSLGVSTPR